MSDTTRLGLPLIEAGQAQKHVTHNEALRLLDGLVQAAVLQRTLAAPPGGAAEGDLHIVGPAPTGAWSGHADHLALRRDGSWTFLVPGVGWGVWVIAESRPVFWTGTVWRPMLEAIGAVGGLAGLGIGGDPDAVNRLFVRSPAALFAAEPTAGGGSGDMRVTIEKEAAADTASLLFQTAWSGRAEIGLAGDDDLRLKVSSDGATWIEALRVVAATGQTVLGSGGLAGGGRLRSTPWFTASGTWTRPAGVRFVLVFALGAGGGGGGAGGSAASGSAGGGGGAGALAIGFLAVDGVVDRAVTVGTGGTGGVISAGTGTAGGASSFGTDVVAGGGAGGVGMTAGTSTVFAIGGAGGTATAGDMTFVGSPGGVGIRLDGTDVAGGNGGASFFGGGGRGQITGAGGAAGTARGSGGAGGTVSNSSTSHSGGAGAAGLVWVWEFE